MEPVFQRDTTEKLKLISRRNEINHYFCSVFFEYITKTHSQMSMNFAYYENEDDCAVPNVQIRKSYLPWKSVSYPDFYFN